MSKTTNWRPIETAPKDGTRVLILCPWKRVVVAAWKGDSWEAYMPWDSRYYRPSSIGVCRDLPTHWMPLDELLEGVR